VNEEYEIRIRPEDPGDIIFCIDHSPEEFIKLSKGKFFFKGQEIEDIHQVYERFSEWLKNLKEIK